MHQNIVSFILSPYVKSLGHVAGAMETLAIRLKKIRLENPLLFLATVEASLLGLYLDEEQMLCILY